MANMVALTMGELDRLQVITRIAERRLTRRRAAILLGLSERQVRRLYAAFTRNGAGGLASRRRGRPSNRRLAAAIRARARIPDPCASRTPFGSRSSRAHRKVSEGFLRCLTPAHREP